MALYEEMRPLETAKKDPLADYPPVEKRPSRASRLEKLVPLIGGTLTYTNSLVIELDGKVYGPQEAEAYAVSLKDADAAQPASE